MKTQLLGLNELRNVCCEGVTFSQLLDPNQASMMKATSLIGQPSGQTPHGTQRNISGSLQQVQNQGQHISMPNKDSKSEINSMYRLKKLLVLMVITVQTFSKFENTIEALETVTKLLGSTLSKGLCKFFHAHCDGETLGVADSKFGNEIKEKLKIDCVHNSFVMELLKGVRHQLTELLSGLGAQQLAPISLDLSHSLSTYKLKSSADKILQISASDHQILWDYMFSGHCRFKSGTLLT